MEAAKQMHAIGQVAAGMTARRLEQCTQIGMARGAIARDTGELSIGDAGLVSTLERTLLADGPIDRHSYPLVLNPAMPSPTVTNARA